MTGAATGHQIIIPITPPKAARMCHHAWLVIQLPEEKDERRAGMVRVASK